MSACGAMLKDDAGILHTRTGRRCSGAYASAVSICGVLADQDSSCVALGPHSSSGSAGCVVSSVCDRHGLVWAVSMELVCALSVVACGDQLAALPGERCRS